MNWPPEVEQPRLPSTAHVLADVARERRRQDEKFPDQRLPNGTSAAFAHQAERYRSICDRADADDVLTWTNILLEETFEALAEGDDDKLRAELVQVAAVAVRWIEDIDSRTVLP